MRAEEEARNNPSDVRPHVSLFPRGAAASPDARYIFQSIDAARQLLHICVDSLAPGGALPYLPNRFLLWFTYAAILLLKAMYSGAMLRADHPGAHRLIERLITCFEEASPDDDHPAVRYGRQLQGLCNILAGMATAANSPSGGPPPGIQAQGSAQYGAPSADDAGQPQWQDDGGYFGQAADVASADAARDIANNLGFATLDDWFKFGGGLAPEQHPVEALDLADFWMKVGPTEAQGGFPFR